MAKLILRTVEDYPVSIVQLLGSDSSLVVEISQPSAYASRSEILAPQEYDGPGGGWSQEEIDALGVAADSHGDNDNAPSVDLSRIRFVRALQSITNGADFEDLGEEQLRQLIKLLFARQREIGREDEELQDMLWNARNSSDTAMWIFDMLDDTH